MSHIYAYYAFQLGVCPEDETLRELPVDSPCGEDCKKAIDAAEELLTHMGAAGCSEHRAAVLAAVFEIVEIYWRG